MKWRQHRFVADGGTSGVVILALHEQKFAMVEHFRPVADRMFLEFPRGFGTEGRDNVPAEAQAVRDAQRELMEETGLRGTDFTALGSIWADSSLIQNSVIVVSGTVTSSRPLRSTDGEADRLIWIPVDQFPVLAASGQIADALTMAAYVRWLAAD
ncbi:NUDIX hydrolase [Arthrobacter koreensis]|jgi:ADP-ribose pyrophosphatase|uniref:NUDIX hydrolase n=1 Tax=Arthrobacter koreensis TaxID=199136 RepID=UPI002409DF0D|nr:NUDIX hydrolase [Arthrobacter koreensis]